MMYVCVNTGTTYNSHDVKNVNSKQNTFTQDQIFFKIYMVHPLYIILSHTPPHSQRRFGSNGIVKGFRYFFNVRWV